MPHGNPDDEDREFEAQKRDEAVDKALQADADENVVSPGAAIDEDLADEDADDEEDDEDEDERDDAEEGEDGKPALQPPDDEAE